MSESELLKERLLTLTERHHVQQEMNLKRSDIDQERQKFNHLKNKARREQWLMGNPAQPTPAQDVEVTALGQRIARMEQELGSLEQLEATLAERGRRVSGKLHAVEETVEKARRKLQADSDEGESSRCRGNNARRPLIGPYVDRST
uniref:Palmdelphin n=1 Tax=Petromyzon marinus TaxID=7757 RepID=A0AAJ7UEZ3_PETMA|nr:palmdelphin-like [Petromyzon marinus]